MFDKEFLDAVMKSAGIGAAIGWVIQFYMWKAAHEERRDLHKFIMEQLVVITNEKAVATAGMNTLTAAVNAVISVVKGGRHDA